MGIEDFLWKLIGNCLSRKGINARLSILIFHRVLPNKDPLRPEEVDERTFDKLMGFISESFNVLPLVEAKKRLEFGKLPSRSVCITFDDGYADNYNVALPILMRWNLPATFFISSGYIDGGCMWNDAIIELLRVVPSNRLNLKNIGLTNYSLTSLMERRLAAHKLINTLKYHPQAKREEMIRQIMNVVKAALPIELMMTSSQVRDLYNTGMDVGGHTINHPILSQEHDDMARREIFGGKEELEGIINGNISVFAYPNGIPGRDYKLEHVKMCKSAGFEGAVTTSWGVATNGNDPFQMPRFTPWDRNVRRFGVRLLSNYRRHGKALMKSGQD
jgi:peptidoglycan/xylan/chitin deacetylase (PgdA/CDA1 family)